MAVVLSDLDGAALSAVALPETPNRRHFIERIEPALSWREIGVLWVKPGGVELAAPWLAQRTFLKTQTSSRSSRRLATKA